MMSGFHSSLFPNANMNTVHPTNTCLCICIKRTLAQVQQPLYGWSQSLGPMQGGKAKSGFYLMFKSGLCQILVVHHCQRGLTMTLNLRLVRMAGNHLVMDQLVQENQNTKGVMPVASSWITVYYFIKIIFICCACWYSSTSSVPIEKHNFQ